MAVESNYANAIATRSDWLKILAPAFQPMKSKTKTDRSVYALFFFLHFEVAARNCKEF